MDRNHPPKFILASDQSILFTLEQNAELNNTLFHLRKSWEAVIQMEIPVVRYVEIPVLYEGVDLERVSQHTGLDIAKKISKKLKKE